MIRMLLFTALFTITISFCSGQNLSGDRFTAKANEGLAKAQQLAISRGNANLLPVHLASVLFNDAEGIAARILSHVPDVNLKGTCSIILR